MIDLRFSCGPAYDGYTVQHGELLGFVADGWLPFDIAASTRSDDIVRGVIRAGVADSLEHVQADWSPFVPSGVAREFQHRRLGRTKLNRRAAEFFASTGRRGNPGEEKWVMNKARVRLIAADDFK